MTETALDGICELVLKSTDAGRMVDFYERLGLERLRSNGDQVWLSAGGRTRIGIWPPGEQEHRDRGGSHVHFALSTGRGRLDAILTAIRESDWAFEGPVTHEGGDRSIYLFDPEGNRVELWDYLDDHDRVPG